MGSLNRFVAAVTGLGIIAAAAVWWAMPPTTPSVAALIVLSVLAVVGRLLPVRFQRRGEVQGFNFVEGVFLASLFLLPPALPVLVVGVGVLIGHAAITRDGRKLAFNTGQTLLWGALAVGVFAAVGGTDPHVLSVRGLAAVLIAAIVLNAVSMTAMAELMRRLHGRPWTATVKEVAGLQMMTSLGNLSFGLVLALLMERSAYAGILAGTLMVWLYLGYRGYADAMEERRRNQALEGVAFTLADVNGTQASVEAFLDGLTTLFRAEDAQLALCTEQGDRIVRRTGSDIEWDVTPDPLLSRVLSQARGRAAMSTGSALLESPTGDALAVPMVHQGRVVGALSISGRSGYRTSVSSDATLLLTLANEAAVVLKNVELFAAVERERGRLAAESRKLGEVVNAASDGIAMIETDGTVSVWNAAMERSTGIDAKTAIGLPWDLAFRARDTEGRDLAGRKDSVIHHILAGQSAATVVDVQVLRRDGDWRWLRCSVSPTARPGALDGAVIVARDVTQEREVSQLKGDFVATVSHELRTPLTPLRGFYETLRSRRDDLSPERTDVILESMGNQLDRLERLVGDLLLVADAHQGVLQLSHDTVDLRAIVTQDVTVSLTVDERSRLSVDGTPSVVAAADAAAVERIVRALVGNGLKHTAGPVRVRVYAEGTKAVVEVADDGPGIAPWEHERVFERFARLGDHLHRVQGSGLGLSIARSLARAQGGDIELESDVGRGSAFRLVLPAVPAEGPSSAESPSQTINGVTALRPRSRSVAESDVASTDHASSTGG